MEFKFVQMKYHATFARGVNSDSVKMQSFWANFTKTLHRVSRREFKFVQIKGRDLFLKGKKCLYYITTWHSSPKPGTGHNRVMGIQLCLYKGAIHFFMGEIRATYMYHQRACAQASLFSMKGSASEQWDPITFLFLLLCFPNASANWEFFLLSYVLR